MTSLTLPWWGREAVPSGGRISAGHCATRSQLGGRHAERTSTFPGSLRFLANRLSP